ARPHRRPDGPPRLADRPLHRDLRPARPVPVLQPGQEGRDGEAAAADLSPGSEAHDGQPEGGRGGAADQRAGGVAQGLGRRSLLDQPDGLEAEGRKRGVGPAEARPQHDLVRRRQAVVEGQAGDEAEEQRPGEVDDQRAPGEDAPAAVGDGPVEFVAGDGPGGPGHHERRPGGRAHRPARPTYFTTSTSSRITSPSVIRSSRSPRNARTRSSVSTMTTATGRSSDSDRSRVVWMWLEAPYPSTPRNTDAPASPAAWARWTISVASGVCPTRSDSPMKIVSRLWWPSSLMASSSGPGRPGPLTARSRPRRSLPPGWRRCRRRRRRRGRCAPAGRSRPRTSST